MDRAPCEVSRPWGSFRTMAFFPGLGACKILKVAPAQRLSLQSHSLREEHWVILSGQVLAQINDETKAMRAGEYICIPCGAWHRLSNESATDWAIVAETQVGAYNSCNEMEADICRQHDDYGRS